MKPFILFFILIQTSLVSAQILTKGTLPDGKDFVLERLHQESGVIWALDFLTSEKIIFTMREGKAYLFDMNARKATRLSGLPADIKAAGQGGLLDVAVSPAYEKDGIVYFTYVRQTPEGGATTLAKAKLHGSSLQEWQILLQTDSATDTTRHYGSRIAFDGQGHLFFGVGDRGVRKSAQQLHNHNGTIMRLHLDGSIPKDNPFINKPHAKAAVYSYGHRNPQGLFFDPNTGILWENEHGPRGGDEINIVKKGANYGWPEISYGKEYWGPVDVGGTHQEGMKQPVYEFTPSIAPSSLLLYRGSAFPSLSGALLSGALAMTHLNVITLNQNHSVTKEFKLLDDFGRRIRDVIEGPKGLIYFSSDSGEIFVMRPAKGD